MRFLLLVYASHATRRGSEPSLLGLARYKQEMTRAGVLLAMDALEPAGTWLELAPDVTVGVLDGTAIGSDSVVCAYCLIQAKSREEALEWAKRYPLGGDTVGVELRQVLDGAN
jgi:hypothetical protein